jgi:hypothetical protein
MLSFEKSVEMDLNLKKDPKRAFQSESLLIRFYMNMHIIHLVLIHQLFFYLA